jgi:hypothetical protein
MYRREVPSLHARGWFVNWPRKGCDQWDGFACNEEMHVQYADQVVSPSGEETTKAKRLIIINSVYLGCSKSRHLHRFSHTLFFRRFSWQFAAACKS